MTSSALAVVEFPRVTGLPADTVENTFALVAQTGTPIDFAAAATHLEAFYTASAVHHTLITYLSDNINKTAAAQIKFYDLEPVIAGSGDSGPPLDIVEFVPGASTLLSGDLPDQVAVVLSISADVVGVPEHSGATRPRARRRGRIFFGPLQGGNQVITVDSGFAHVATPLRDDLKNAASLLESDFADGGNAFWSVWSRKDLVLREVTHGWIDNSFDTQRRRTVESTTRTLWP